MKYILLSLLLIGQVFGQIINNDGGTTIDGNLTVATNVTTGGNITVGSGKYIAISGSSTLIAPSYIRSVDFSIESSAARLRFVGVGNNVSYIYLDGSGALGQRINTSPQTWRTYGTWSDASNFERISMAHDGSGLGTIGVESSGTGSADQSLKIQLAGNGALYVDGDTAGNARGANAVDLQVNRSAATQVASGSRSSIIGGLYNTASGNYSAVIAGGNSVSSGAYAIASGEGSVASSTYTVSSGSYSSAYLYGQRAFASGRFAATGDAQGSRLVMRNTTTGSSADLFLDGSSARAVIPANTTWMFEITVSARSTDGGTGDEESAAYKYTGCIERDGANNTALVGTVTEMVVAEDDADWSVSVTADDTNEALDINVTSDDANTVRWVAVITLTEVGG